jgi:hypothetical protein
MEINVSQLFSEDCGLLSASQFELGPDAGAITWRNALELAESFPLINDENRDAVRSHFRAYGAWDRAEIEAWTDRELTAMVWQEGAACMREYEDHCSGNLEKYREGCEAGTLSGRMHISDDASEAWLYLGI